MNMVDIIVYVWILFVGYIASIATGNAAHIIFGVGIILVRCTDLIITTMKDKK